MRKPAVAILSPGEMGSAIGRLLADSGTPVLTWVADRSEATRRRAGEAGFEVVPDLGSVVRRAAAILSVVPPVAAEPLARQVAAALRSTGASPLYVDANSIGPETARTIGRQVVEAGGRFVDGALIGAAAELHGRTELYLAGEESAELATILEPLRTRILGSKVGDASAFKVLYAGLTKGVTALGVELLSGAQRLGLQDELLARYEADYPDVARFWRRVLPGLAPRAGRRAQEMAELSGTLDALGLDAAMTLATQAVLERIAERNEALPGSAEGTLAEFLSSRSAPRSTEGTAR